MENLVDAVAALSCVKGRMPLSGSDNKKFKEVDPTTMAAYERSMQHREKWDKVANKMRSHPRFPGIALTGGATPTNIVNYGAFALAAGAGNCLEYCCAVIWHLNQQGRFNYDMVHYGTAGDHIFTVIGQGSGGLPDDFGAWNQDAAICDVWADIACPARDYPARWRARMNNWAIMGLDLGGRKATDAVWYDLVDKPKLSYFKI